MLIFEKDSSFAETKVMMKKIFIFVILLTLTSCGMRYVICTNSIDYSAYTKDNFFITESNSVSFNYDPVGSISVDIFSGLIDNPKKPTYTIKVGAYNSAEIYNPEWGKTPPKIMKYASYEDALFYLSNRAKKMGANGIINLKFRTIIGQYGQIESICATGMAIRR